MDQFKLEKELVIVDKLFKSITKVVTLLILEMLHIREKIKKKYME